MDLPNCIYILSLRDIFQRNSGIRTFQREKTLNFKDCYLNSKENAIFVPHLKGVQCFPVSQNVNNFPNVEGPWTLSQKILTSDWLNDTIQFTAPYITIKWKESKHDFTQRF